MATTSRLSPLTMATAYYDLLDQLLLTMATTYYDLIKEVGLREDGEHAHAAAPQLVQYLTVRGAPDQGERWGQAQAQRDIEGGGEGGGRGRLRRRRRRRRRLRRRVKVKVKLKVT